MEIFWYRRRKQSQLILFRGSLLCCAQFNFLHSCFATYHLMRNPRCVSMCEYSCTSLRTSRLLLREHCDLLVRSGWKLEAIYWSLIHIQELQGRHTVEQAPRSSMIKAKPQLLCLLCDRHTSQLQLNTYWPSLLPFSPLHLIKVPPPPPLQVKTPAGCYGLKA